MYTKSFLCLWLSLSLSLSYGQQAPGWGTQVNEDITDFVRKNITASRVYFEKNRGQKTSWQGVYYAKSGLDGYSVKVFTHQPKDVFTLATRNQSIAKKNLEEGIARLHRQIKAAVPAGFRSYKQGAARVKFSHQNLAPYQRLIAAKKLDLWIYMHPSDLAKVEPVYPIIMLAVKKSDRKYFRIELTIKSPVANPKPQVATRTRPTAQARPNPKPKPAAQSQSKQVDTQKLIQETLAEIRATKKELAEKEKALENNTLDFQVWNLKMMNKAGHFLPDDFVISVSQQSRMWLKKNGKYVGGALKVKKLEDKLNPTHKFRVIKYGVVEEDKPMAYYLEIADLRTLTEAQKKTMQVSGDFLISFGKQGSPNIFMGNLVKGKL
ncbi:MAG: hypothetical protein AAFR61_02540 [Bacteroidota bacterium]